MNDKKTLHERLTEMKNARNLTNDEIARMSGVSASTLSRIFSGQHENPSYQSLDAIVSAMGYSVADLYTDASHGHDAAAPSTMDRMLVMLQANYEKTLEESRAEKRRWFLIAVVLIVFIMFLLGWDITHPDMGYIRY